jgi:hypothetical protein
MSIRSRAVEGLLFGLIATLGNAAIASGAPNPEMVCLRAKFALRAKDAACFEKAALRHQYGSTTDLVRDYTAFGKCTRQYVGAWGKLQIKNSGLGTPCDGARFTDNGDGTVTDRMTELQWEQKHAGDALVNPSDPHDADNIYTLNAGGADTTSSNGTAFTSFLAALNGACFAGHCDWRLPTIDELRTLLAGGYPDCPTSPCIDPVFGAQLDATWSGTDELGHSYAWEIDFDDAMVSTRGKTAADHVRAVRGGPGQ